MFHPENMKIRRRLAPSNLKELAESLGQSDMELFSSRKHENATADPSTPSATADSGRDDTSVGE